MAEKSLNTRIQNKCDTTANWAKATNFVPKKGEIIIYSDGGGTGIPKMKVGDGATKVGSLKFADEGQYLPLTGGTLTGPLNLNDYMTIKSVAGGGSDFNYHGITFYEPSIGPNNSSAHVVFQYRTSTSGAHTTRVVAPEFEGKLIGNADTATSASKVNGHTVNSDVPADAKFTDTVYTLPTASSSTLGGIKLGTGLTAAADGTVNVSVGGATITLKTWTDADVA